MQHCFVQYLTNFGEADTLSEQDTALAEKYLVRVKAGARSSTAKESFDDLRGKMYITSFGIDTLPPTTSVIRGHIQRAAFLVHSACTLLTTAKERREREEPLKHGWEENFGALLPSK